MSTKTKHTPGPWKIHDNIGRKNELGVVADAAPCIIAIMGNAKAWPMEADANANLIAAAPEMFEALRECITDDGAFCFKTQTELALVQRINAISSIARRAIAKAKGGK